MGRMEREESTWNRLLFATLVCPVACKHRGLSANNLLADRSDNNRLNMPSRATLPWEVTPIVGTSPVSKQRVTYNIIKRGRNNRMLGQNIHEILLTILLIRVSHLQQNLLSSTWLTFSSQIWTSKSPTEMKATINDKILASAGQCLVRVD